MSRAAINSKKPVTTSAPSTNAHTKPIPAAQAGAIREVKPTVDQIRARAYQLYIERTARGDRGDAAADWLRAERELSHKPG
jgi:hypothetical protein